MKYKEIKELIEKNKNFVEFSEFGNGISKDWILKAQNHLNIKFPTSYIWWLENYGGGEINGDEIYSIYEIDFDKVVGGDIVYINNLNRKRGQAQDVLVIQETDFGDVFYFNLSETDIDGEAPIYNLITKKNMQILF